MHRVTSRSARWLLQYRMASSSAHPMEDAIRSKLSGALQPVMLEIRNDSHLHSHHRAMADSTSKETHFAVTIISDQFKSKLLSARHRMIYSLLKDELSQEGGIHALQLTTRTPEEEEIKRVKETAAA